MSTKPKSRVKTTLNIRALSTETIRVWGTVIRSTAIKMPASILRSRMVDSPLLGGFFDKARLSELVGASVLDLFDRLGPIYGKAAQVGLSRLPKSLHDLAHQLQITRLYGDWPRLPFVDVEKLLDKELPHWRQHLSSIDPLPIGVASMGQVHAAVGIDGKNWVVKIVKPRAERRLLETLAALDEVIAKAQIMAVTRQSKRFVEEFRALADGFRREIDLRHERATIDRVNKLFAERNIKGVLRLTSVFGELCSQRVLTVERFEGLRLSDVVSGKTELNTAQKKRLAKGVLQELLIQVFELGLFHADPHAGNLILLDDGTVGLFDWGLAGELMESDRKHIAALLRAVMMMDLDRLIGALHELAVDGGKDISQDRIKKEIDKLSRRLKKLKGQGSAGNDELGPSSKASFHALIQECLKSASRLDIPVPNGLILMAKSLITIEGLAKGIDPEVSMKLIAAPILFRAAKPTWVDLVSVTRQLPKLWMHLSKK